MQNTLQEEGFDDDAELDSAIKKLENDLKKVRKKDADGDELEDEPPSFPLLDVPDADVRCLITRPRCVSLLPVSLKKISLKKSASNA